MSDINDNMGLILEKIKNLHDCVDRVEKSFSEFKVGIGSTVQDHDRRIVVMEAHISILMKMAWAVFGCSVVVLVGQVLKLVFK